MWLITRLAAVIFMLLMVVVVVIGTVITPFVPLVFKGIDITTSYQDFYKTVAEYYVASFCVLWKGKKACV